jgi:short-subunit dehydrogenase
MRPYRSVLITGASSGIGAALAVAVSRPGTDLHLSGRDTGRLEATAARCRERGATVHARIMDVCDAAAMEAWIAEAAPIDLVVANAGISAGSGRTAGEHPGQTRDIFATNLNGALNTVLPAMAAMRGQPAGPDGVRGRIAVIASIAAFVPVPDSPAYCASKAAIDAWTVASARSARKSGVQLTSVCPGYIRTAMTARNRFPMPGLMDADRAAGIILRGIEAGKIRLAFPWWMAALARLGGLLPPRLLGKLLPDLS